MDANLSRLGRFSREELDHIIRESARMPAPGGRIAFLSEKLLDTTYTDGTLMGGNDIPEVFVLNLSEVDCMTFIEYIEAMRRSGSYGEFEENLRRVRYRSGDVQFTNRHHFFTDWIQSWSEYVEDVSESLGAGRTAKVQKVLNVREDGTHFLPGVQPIDREIRYIPAEAVDPPLLKRLETGDYIGIYAGQSGLDVSHTGIFIRKGENLFLRHASSRRESRKVLDQGFADYIADTPGIIVFRPR